MYCPVDRIPHFMVDDEYLAAELYLQDQHNSNDILNGGHVGISHYIDCNWLPDDQSGDC